MIRDQARRRAILAVVCAALVLLAPQTTQAAPETVSLSGSVVDTDGKAIAGAELFITPASWWPGVAKWKSPTAQSDTAGHFQLILPRLADNGRPIYPATLWALKSGRRLAWQKLSSTPGVALPPVRLVLGPPSTLRIKVLAPEGKPVAGAQVTISAMRLSGPKDRPGQPIWESPPLALQSRMAAVSDNEGAALVTAVLLENVASVEITSPHFGKQTYYGYETLPADKSITLAPMGRVRGRLVADKPEASRNIPVSITTSQRRDALTRYAYAEAITDNQGRFEVPIAEGELHVGVVRQQLKPAYLCPIAEEKKRVLRAGETVEMELRVVPAVRVHGVMWERGTKNRMPKMGINYQSAASTFDWTEPDAGGRYEFYRAAGELYFHVTCTDSTIISTWLCSHVVAIPAGVKEFELPPIELCHARGRVVDETGKPVAGATIGNVCYKVPGNEPHHPQDNVRSVGSVKPVHTDAEGRFEAWVEAAQKYRLAIRADGMLPAETDWIDFSATAVIPDIVLRRLQLRTVAGRVVDRQHRPVAAATVFQTASGPKRTEAVTDKDGKFRLGGILDDTAFIFVKKAGFRFAGRMVEGPAGDLELVVAHADEPAERPLRTLPFLPARAERLAMAKRLLGPTVKQVLSCENALIVPLTILAKVEPERALQLLEEKAVKEPFVEDMIRRAVAIEFFKESPDEARTVVESMLNPFCRSETYLDFCDAVPATERPRKLELIGQALLQMRGITEPWMRVMSHGEIAKRLLALGQRDRATKLLREGQVAANSLSTADIDGYGRALLAEQLSRVDLPAALELIKDLSDHGEYFRHHGNIAHMVAGTNPAEAERILRMLEDRDKSFVSGQYAPRVCYRMATADLARAKRIAAHVTDPYQKAQAHAVMAQALVNTQPAAARELLERAFEVLEESIKNGKSHFDGQHDSPSVAAAFLPVAEQLDPRLVDEFLWRAISLRQHALTDNGPTNRDRPQGDRPHPRDAYLAMVLARYDRAVAGALFAPNWKRIQGELSDQSETRAALAAAAMLDPKRAVAIVEGLPDGEAKRQAGYGLAKFLALDDDKCWDYIERQLLVLWVVDEEDFGADD
jgi:hypothetical protein